jgi:hypothetical protein
MPGYKTYSLAPSQQQFLDTYIELNFSSILNTRMILWLQHFFSPHTKQFSIKRLLERNKKERQKVKGKERMSTSSDIWPAQQCKIIKLSQKDTWVSQAWGRLCKPVLSHFLLKQWLRGNSMWQSYHHLRRMMGISQQKQHSTEHRCED